MIAKRLALPRLCALAEKDIKISDIADEEPTYVLTGRVVELFNADSVDAEWTLHYAAERAPLPGCPSTAPLQRKRSGRLNDRFILCFTWTARSSRSAFLPLHSRRPSYAWAYFISQTFSRKEGKQNKVLRVSIKYTT